MNLQKNDKIILVVGVVILIAAAGAIAIYMTQSNGDDSNLGNQADEVKTFEVKWSVETKELDGKTYTLNLPRILSFLNKGKSVADNNCFTLDQDNIKSIEINVSYTDSKMGLPILGFFGKGALGIGKDVLTVAIIAPDEEEYKKTIVGNGKATITMEGKVRPFSTSLKAESLEEAQTKLQENYSKEFAGETFKLKASLTIKLNERILLLNRIFERFIKDTFKIDITYHYYKYTLEEIIEEDNLENNNDEDKVTGVADLYLFMAYGRQMI
ncbi:MAG: hypothetical protein JXA91_02460 [Candidatus Thermoplasmatota archaeon]|nr:hypothetical protein [Candidatus Thermoplasmatota archaeon]